MTEDYPQVTVESREQWRSWLAANHATARGVWLTRYKKGTGRGHLTYDALVEESLCFGWIDSRPRLDGERSQTLVTARRQAAGRASTSSGSSGSRSPA